MSSEEYFDSIDKLLFEYFENEPEKEIPQTIRKIPQIAIKKVKFKNNIRKLNKVAVAIITITLMTTGIVFAKDIMNFITSIFTNSTPAIDTAVENGYIQDIDMDYIFDNNVGIKIKHLLIDDSNIDISLYYKIDDTNIKSIKIEDYEILNENNDLIYGTTYRKINLADFIIRNEPTVKIDNETYNESILFKFAQNKKEFHKIYVKINKLKIIKIDDSIEYINGIWEIETQIDKEMNDNTNIMYRISDNEYIESFSAELTSTELKIQLKLNIPINLEQF